MNRRLERAIFVNIILSIIFVATMLTFYHGTYTDLTILTLFITTVITNMLMFWKAQK